MKNDAPALRDTFLSPLVQSYRDLWGRHELPFVVVQLPNYGSPAQRSPLPEDTVWPRVREAQLQASGRVPRLGLAVTIDIGGPLHPGRKDVVGQRLALAALGVAYGRTNAVCSGPIFKFMTITGNTVRVAFDGIGSGLKARDPETGEEDGPLKGFALAGSNRVFFAAEAVITSNTVVVSCPGVPRPAAVRYAFHQNPQCDLYNAEGLPASPFRSDDWP